MHKRKPGRLAPVLRDSLFASNKRRAPTSAAHLRQFGQRQFDDLFLRFDFLNQSFHDIPQSLRFTDLGAAPETGSLSPTRRIVPRTRGLIHPWYQTPAIAGSGYLLR